jgi:hypothetical protein
MASTAPWPHRTKGHGGEIFGRLWDHPAVRHTNDALQTVTGIAF